MRKRKNRRNYTLFDRVSNLMMFLLDFPLDDPSHCTCPSINLDLVVFYPNRWYHKLICQRNSNRAPLRRERTAAQNEN